MAQFQPRIRARLLDDDGNVITPRSGACHSDDFQVATEADTGWLPYIIDVPNPPANALDRLTGRTQISDVELVLQDARVGGSNTERWVTAFFGDDAGAVQLNGPFLEITRELTTGAGYDPYFYGRVTNIDVPGPETAGAVVRIRARDERIQERRMCFVGAPHPATNDYAQPSPLCPIGGRVIDYGPFRSSLPSYTGIIRDGGIAGAAAVVRSTVSGARTGGSIELSLTKEMATRLDRIERSDVVGMRYCPQVRVRITRLDTDASGDFFVCQTERPTLPLGALGDVAVSGTPYDGGNEAATAMFVDGSPARVAAFGIVPIPESMDQGAHPLKYMALPEEDTVVRWTIYNAGPPSEKAPILIGDVHPARLEADLSRGYFSFLNDSGRDGDPNDGEVSFGGIPLDTDYADAEDWSMQRLRMPVDKPWKMEDFKAEQITKVSHLVSVANASGELVPRDLRISDASVGGIPTIVAADIVSGDWEHGADVLGEIRVTAYAEEDYFVHTLARLGGQVLLKETIYDAPCHGIVQVAMPVPFLTAKAPHTPGRSISIDAQGIRYSGINTTLYHMPQGQRAREMQVKDPYEQQYGTGAATLRLVCRRTANTAGRLPGDYVLVDYAGPPDPATCTRDGARLMLVTDSREDPFGPHVVLKLLDGGPNSAATAPTIGTLALGAPGEHVVEIPVTLNANDDHVELQIAVTATSEGSAPAATSPLWTPAGRAYADATITVDRLPSGRRVWVRGRSIADKTKASDWTLSSGTDYVDTDALDPPTGATATVDGRSVRLAWTVGSAGYPLMPTLDGVDARTTPLQPGSDAYVFEGLEAATEYDFGVRHVDPYGGASAIDDDTATTGTADQLAGVRRIDILQGGNSPYARQPDESTVGIGIEVAIRPGEFEAATLVQISTDSTFADPFQVTQIVLPPGQTRAMHFTPKVTAEHHARAMHTRDGYLDSVAWSPVRSAYPTALMAEGADPLSDVSGWQQFAADLRPPVIYPTKEDVPPGLVEGGLIVYERDTGDSYMWNATTEAWDAIAGSGTDGSFVFFPAIVAGSILVAYLEAEVIDTMYLQAEQAVIDSLLVGDLVIRGICDAVVLMAATGDFTGTVGIEVGGALEFYKVSGLDTIIQASISVDGTSFTVSNNGAASLVLGAEIVGMIAYSTGVIDADNVYLGSGSGTAIDIDADDSVGVITLSALDIVLAGNVSMDGEVGGWGANDSGGTGYRAWVTANA